MWIPGPNRSRPVDDSGVIARLSSNPLESPTHVDGPPVHLNTLHGVARDIGIPRQEIAGRRVVRCEVVARHARRNCEKSTDVECRVIQGERLTLGIQRRIPGINRASGCQDSSQPATRLATDAAYCAAEPHVGVVRDDVLDAPAAHIGVPRGQAVDVVPIREARTCCGARALVESDGTCKPAGLPGEL